MITMQSSHRQYYYSYESAKRRQFIDALMFLFDDFGKYRDLIYQASLILVANFPVFVELLQWFVEYADVIISACWAMVGIARIISAFLDWCEAVYIESCGLWGEVGFLFTGRLQYA